MKTNLLVSIGGIWMNILSALGVTHYVDANNANPSPPFLSWNAAATNIQDALDASSVGDEVLVTNGIYRNGGSLAPFDPTTTNRASVNKAVSLRSVNGAALTLIDGLGTNRCVFLSSGALLRGFTLTNGVGYQGAGLFCENTNSPVYDCFLVNNIAQGGGGGGVQGGTLINCVLKSNSNFAGRFSGMGGAGARGSVLNNCAVVGNFSTTNGGGVASSILNNCTVVANSAWSVGGGAWGSTLNNCIIYSNSAVVDSVGNYFSCGIENSCTTPMPASGTGNIVGNPLFLSVESGNLRLQSNSPCINRGNNSDVTSSTDLDGDPRIFNGVVDIGAYEFVPAPTLRITRANATITLAWALWPPNFTLQQSVGPLPTPGNWANVPGTPDVINNELVLIVPIDATLKFYRLYRP